jgi:hypothetical protein
MFGSTWGDRSSAESEDPGYIPTPISANPTIKGDSLQTICTLSFSMSGDTVCQNFNHAGENIKVTVLNLNNVKAGIAIAESLNNYEDAYYDFKTGKWNCESPDTVNDDHLIILDGEGSESTVTVPVEAKHSTFFGKYTVQGIYVRLYFYGHEDDTDRIQITYEEA